MRNNKSKHKHLQNAFNKYGEENFELVVLEYCSLEELDERECYYMTLYDVENREHGYNKKSGGQHGGSRYSEESRKRMSESQKILYQKDPKKRHNELSEQFKKVWANPEYHDSRVGEKHPFYGKHHTEETKEKMKKAHAGKPGHPTSPEAREKQHLAHLGQEPWQKDKRPVYCIELDKVFENATVAVKELGLSKNHITEVCEGKRQTTGGYHWQFVIEENDLGK